MLLVSTTWVTNQMSENMLVLIYTTQSIDRFTCCLKPEKTDSFIVKHFSAFGKSEKSENFLIGSFGLSGVTCIWGPISVGPNDIGSDHMYDWFTT